MKLTNSFDIAAENTDGTIQTLFAVIKLDESDLAETSVEFYTAADEESLSEFLVDSEKLDEYSFIIQKVAQKTSL